MNFTNPATRSKYSTKYKIIIPAKIIEILKTNVSTLTPKIFFDGAKK
jgi:hypothetical protein